MAENLKVSQPKGKRNTTGTAGDAQTVQPQDALEALRSASEWLRQAGLRVRAGNHNGSLVLVIAGAQVNAGNFVLVTAQTDAGDAGNGEAVDVPQ